MKLTIYRTLNGWAGQLRTDSGLLLACTRADSWVDCWIRLSRLCSLLRLRHSLKISA